MNLYSWEEVADKKSIVILSKVELVKKALEKAGKPLHSQLINSYINEYMKKVNSSPSNSIKITHSILSYLTKDSMGVLRLVDGSYILKSWKYNYRFLLSTTSKITKHDTCIAMKSILLAQPDNTMIQSEFYCKLISKGYARSTIASTLKRTKDFVKLEYSDKHLICLIDNKESNNTKQKDILDRIVDLLSAEQGYKLPLRFITSHIKKDFSLTKTQISIVYKVIGDNPFLFFKEKDGGPYITLLTSSTSSSTL